jgi:hypothetical protein
MEVPQRMTPPRLSDGVASRPVTTAIVISVGVTLACLAVTALLLRSPPPERVRAARFSGDVRPGWAEARAAAEAHLSGFSWVDRRGGVVRIPIADAMALVCEEPVR